MKAETITQLLEQWNQVKADRKLRRECEKNTEPGERPFSLLSAQTWDNREEDLSRALISAMPELEPLLFSAAVESPRITEIELGGGKVAISSIGDREGSSILFRPIDQPMPIGSVPASAECIGDQYVPRSGDVIIRCPKRKSALMLIEAVAVVLGSFSLCDEVQE